jgi:acetyltransferase-like isoleucine patch superfamily enzyme
VLGDDVLVGEYSNLRPAFSFIRIGSRVQLAQFVSMIATNHAVDDQGAPTRAADLRPGKHGITIGDDCWFGAGAVVLAGVELGPRCIVGAGAVVTRSYPAGSKLVGVPARPLGSS